MRSNLFNEKIDRIRKIIDEIVKDQSEEKKTLKDKTSIEWLDDYIDGLISAKNIINKVIEENN